MSNTAGKLTINGKWIQSENGRGVAYVGCPYMDDEDSRRLVACWNAMNGIDDPELWVAQMKFMDSDHAISHDIIKELQRERDELAKALRDLYMHGFSINMSDRVSTILARYPEDES